MPLKRSRGRESVEEEGRSLDLPCRRYDLRERVGGIAAMPERIIREDVQIRDGMMIDSDCEDDFVITGVRTVEQKLASEGHEIVMVHDYVSVSSKSSASPSFALSLYSPISYESDPKEDQDPPISPYVPEAVDHSPDSPFALLWEGTSPILCFKADMRADAIPTFDGGFTSGIKILFCFICGEDGHYPQDCQFYTQYIPWPLLVSTVESMSIMRLPVC
ncbi:Zinc finger CCHC-type [Arabidopsis thaliana x Arabidopsis arenosa]|uniref:Zinc finger CCHC-type n=1 Tax=Arabidopsis thaliana x Arabidopsis arenosa TaxID=1240361 RepID=A0A8T2FI26_9BRAS|nr:Zinc finger CCHC-type [Arabidopsis thaliana x Arabidopsis arenosa]